MQENLKIYCNNIFLDVSDDTSLRLNKVLADPTKMNSRESEYSYSVDLPATPANNRCFGYANHLNVSAKFSKRLPCKVYSGEILVFEGTLLLQSFSAPEQTYSANLVSIKVNTVDDIFGETTMYDLQWYQPYNGAPTINSVNADQGSDVYFPLVAYGVFEKNPYFSDEVANDYTDRLLLDSTTLFFHETFMPSVNWLSTVERCFKQKGYNLTGDIYQDQWLRNLYLSVSLPNEQIPVYNLANPKIGSLDISINWSNEGRTSRTLADSLVQDLDWPYRQLLPPSHGGGDAENPIWHWKEIEFYNVFDKNQATVTENIQSYLFDDGEQCVVIPADGAYRIELDVTATLDTTWNSGKVKGDLTFWTGSADGGTEDYELELVQDILENTPLEVQLVRNVVNDDGQIELIKGKNNYQYRQTTLSAYTASTFTTCYPHENAYQAGFPSKKIESGLGWQLGSYRGTDYSMQLGYWPQDNTIMAFDPNVSRNFICGFSSCGGGTMSVIKNGRSWYKGQAESEHSFYVQPGYTWNSTRGSSATTYGHNTYNDAPQSTVSVNGNTLTGHLVCTVWLNKDDLLTLNMVHRYFDTSDTGTTTSPTNRYKSRLTARLKMNALTPHDYSRAREDNLGYNSDSQFDYNLRIGNFLSSGTTMASFVNNFITAFNLDYQQQGNTVTLNKGKINSSELRDFVDIDGKAAWNESQWSKIDFPREMGVKYADDKDSWGFWETVPSEYRNSHDWKEHGDTGYDIVQLDQDSTSTNIVSVNEAYCYYQPFTLVEYDEDGETESGRTALNLPVIGKYSILAEGSDYEEAMKDDSLSEKQRSWFRGYNSGKQVKIQNEDESIMLYVPEGIYGGVENSYHAKGDTMLTRYFNIARNVNLDKVEVECVLTPLEYQRIANGADVKFDDGLWQVCEISGYDVESKEPATLTLVRKEI